MRNRDRNRNWKDKVGRERKAIHSWESEGEERSKRFQCKKEVEKIGDTKVERENQSGDSHETEGVIDRSWQQTMRLRQMRGGRQDKMEDQKKKEYDDQTAVSYLKLNWLHRQGSIPEQLL